MADLSKTLLASRVRALYEGRRSGVLVVLQGNTSKGVFFRNGHVVFASSTLDKEKLGENLIRLGRISRGDFLQAVQANAGAGKRIGQTLVEAGLISDEELGRLVAHQVQKIVLSLFTWTTGEMKFHEAPEAIPEDLALDLSTSRLLFEGVRIFPDLGRLERSLPAAGRRLKLVTRPPFDHAAIAFTPAERTVLTAAADELTIAETLEGQKRELLVRAVAALLFGGIVEEEGRAHGEAVDGDTGTFRLALPAEEPPPGEDVRTRILRLYESLNRATHFEMLEVEPDADVAQVHAAHARLVEEEKGWAEVAKEARFASLVSTIRMRRRQAHAILSDRGRRESYDRALRGVRPVREAPGLPSLEAADPKRESARLLREARKALAGGDHDRAITQLIEASRLHPEDAESRALLAVTLSEHPSLHRSAERHFRAALELAPDDIELRYRLATYYKKVGLPRRALSELQSVLAQDPKHKDASTLARVLERSLGR